MSAETSMLVANIILGVFIGFFMMIVILSLSGIQNKLRRILNKPAENEAMIRRLEGENKIFKALNDSLSKKLKRANLKADYYEVNLGRNPRKPTLAETLWTKRAQLLEKELIETKTKLYALDAVVRENELLRSTLQKLDQQCQESINSAAALIKELPTDHVGRYNWLHKNKFKVVEDEVDAEK